MMSAQRVGVEVPMSVATAATLTLEQAARYIGMSESWLYKNKGRIPHLRQSRRVQFRQADLDRWLETQVVRPVR